MEFSQRGFEFGEELAALGGVRDVLEDAGGEFFDLGSRQAVGVLGLRGFESTVDQIGGLAAAHDLAENAFDGFAQAAPLIHDGLGLVGDLREGLGGGDEEFLNAGGGGFGIAGGCGKGGGMIADQHGAGAGSQIGIGLGGEEKDKRDLFSCDDEQHAAVELEVNDAGSSPSDSSSS